MSWNFFEGLVGGRSVYCSEKIFSLVIGFAREIKLPRQSVLFCVLDSVVELPDGHIKHSSCALNSWYDPIGQSSHLPVALSK